MFFPKIWMSIYLIYTQKLLNHCWFVSVLPVHQWGCYLSFWSRKNLFPPVGMGLLKTTAPNKGIMERYYDILKYTLTDQAVLLEWTQETWLLWLTAWSMASPTKDIYIGSKNKNHWQKEKTKNKMQRDL